MVETYGEGIQHTWVGVGACIIARRGPSTARDVDTSCGVTGLLVVCCVHVRAGVQSQYVHVCKLYKSAPGTLSALLKHPFQGQTVDSSRKYVFTLQ